MIKTIRALWNRSVVTKVKHFVLAIFFIIFTLTGFWYQNKEARHQQCLARADSRHDLRETLFFIIDLSDILPHNPDAEVYTNTRHLYIDITWPELKKSSC